MTSELAEKTKAGFDLKGTGLSLKGTGFSVKGTGFSPYVTSSIPITGL
jgi:hypothetical protein